MRIQSSDCKDNTTNIDIDATTNTKTDVDTAIPTAKRHKKADDRATTCTGSTAAATANDSDPNNPDNPNNPNNDINTNTDNNMKKNFQETAILHPKPDLKEVARLLQKFPLSDAVSHFGYGTAGFRFKANLMEGLMVRVGIIAALRAFQQHVQQHGQGQVGVMVTASHNDETYNGVKMADPHGGMLAADYEVYATKLVNERNIPTLMAQLESAMAEYNNSSGGTAAYGVVHIGRDTRSHSPCLSELVVRTALSMGATIVHHGIITTPILHHCVLHANAASYLPIYISPHPNTVGYIDLLAHAYWNLIQTVDNNNHNDVPLVVDCACGVGYPLLSALSERIQIVSQNKARMVLPNNGPGDGPLNEGCGSEYVQKQVQSPTWYTAPTTNSNNTSTNDFKYCASLDGDSDRIVFFSSDSNNKFTLLDGDKIAVLICEFLQDQLSVLYQKDAALPKLKLGVVQTAYANGASTNYLQAKLGNEKVLIAKTGVKHVHHAAEDNFDIGIYFEANGHGTVIFNNKAFGNLLQSCSPAARSTKEWQRLRLLPSLINPAVGDALSDLLLVDAILTIRGWTIENPWSKLYKDFPSRQLKVPVPNPKVVQTNHNETRSLEPKGLQAELDRVVAQYEGGRAFVRPSGTEAVVRVYAEANDQTSADKLAAEAEQLVHKYCGGREGGASPRGRL